MSRNHKAPLLAFVLVALVCSLVLLDAFRGEAVNRQISVLHPSWATVPGSTFVREPTDPSDRGAEGQGASGEPAVPADLPESPPLPGAPAAGVEPSVGDDRPPADEPIGSGAGSFSAPSSGDSGSTGSGPDDAPAAGDPGEEQGGPSNGNGQGVVPGLPGAVWPGPKDPVWGIGNLGPDGGRPDLEDLDDLVPVTDPTEQPEGDTERAWIDLSAADLVEGADAILTGASGPDARRQALRAQRWKYRSARTSARDARGRGQRSVGHGSKLRRD